MLMRYTRPMPWFGFSVTL